MSPARSPRRPLLTLFASAWFAVAFPIVKLEAQEAGSAQAAPVSQKTAMTMLIDRLVERGSLTKADAGELLAQANADAADQRVQAAEVLLAAAKSDAAVARAQAAAAQAAFAMARAEAAAGQASAARGAVAQVSAAQIAAAKAILGLPAASAVPVAAAEAPNPVSSPPEPTTGPAVVESAIPAPAAGPAAEAPPQAVETASSEAAGSKQAPQPEASRPLPTAAPEAEATASPTENPVLAAANTVVANGIGGDQTGDQPKSVADVLGEGSSSRSEPASASPAEAERATRVSDALGETTPAPQPSAAEAQVAVTSPDAQASVPAPEPVAVNPSEQATGTMESPVQDQAASAPARVVEDAGDSAARGPAPASAGSGEGDTIRVAYVPDVVRNQITQEVKSEVIAQARDEGWGQKVPDWVTRFSLYGDVRLRFEEIVNHSTNDNSGSFLNFNAVNTGAPYDVSLIHMYPTFDVDQNRQRERLRARLGAAVDLKNGFTVGLRVATGNDDSPVTENQTFGSANNGQGGDFSKYALWLDRGFIKYQGPGDPASSFSLTMGRFENPFFSTPMMWANDLGFDGLVLKVPVKARMGGDSSDTFKPFLVAGAFPVFNTDLNFATISSAKYPSYDKWLDAVQAGLTWKVTSDLVSKSAAALYYYKNIQGQLSTPFVPTSATDQGNTDDSRPSFAQNGNTYMKLRDIVPATSNGNGGNDQWQYFGLATPFHDLTFTQEFDYTHFEPFDITLVGEYVTNLAFNAQQISAVAVNNIGAPLPSEPAPFVGGNKGWFLNFKVGDALMTHAGDWNVSVGYRHLESDAVVDGFTDADFGGILTGTNLKGFTLGASVALAQGVWLEGHFYSATAIAGPTYKNDLFQLDVNAKF